MRAKRPPEGQGADSIIHPFVRSLPLLFVQGQCGFLEDGFCFIRVQNNYIYFARQRVLFCLPLRGMAANGAQPQIRDIRSACVPIFQMLSICFRSKSQKQSKKDLKVLDFPVAGV